MGRDLYGFGVATVSKWCECEVTVNCSFRLALVSKGRMLIGGLTKAKKEANKAEGLDDLAKGIPR